MADFTIYLFDNKKDLKKITDKTLFVNLSESHIDNYNHAKTRKSIKDWQGSLLYINQAIKQNKFVDDYHILKMEIFLELNQFDFAVINCFKAYCAEGGEKELEDSKVMKILKMHYINLEKDIRLKFQAYVDFYIKLYYQTKNFDEFAFKLMNLEIFYLDPKVIKEEHKYSLFLQLRENFK